MHVHSDSSGGSDGRPQSRRTRFLTISEYSLTRLAPPRDEEEALRGLHCLDLAQIMPLVIVISFAGIIGYFIYIFILIYLLSSSRDM
jgi:hypothetical protein